MESNDRAEDAIHDGNILRKNLEEARDQLKYSLLSFFKISVYLLLSFKCILL